MFNSRRFLEHIDSCNNRISYLREDVHTLDSKVEKRLRHIDGEIQILDIKVQAAIDQIRAIEEYLGVLIVHKPYVALKKK